MAFRYDAGICRCVEVPSQLFWDACYLQAGQACSDKHAFPDPLHRRSISAHMSRVILACTFCFIPLQNVPRGCHEGCFSFPFSSLCKDMPRKMVKHFVFPVPRLFVPAIFLPQLCCVKSLSYLLQASSGSFFLSGNSLLILKGALQGCESSSPLSRL